jgi:DNA-binding MarR family transcriptional regulator
MLVMYDPEPGPESDVLATINEVPKAFFRLTAIAETVFADLGVSAAERGIMRDLFIEGEATAPEIARRKPVTRQSIQPVLDGLVAKGLAGTVENPRHKRSKLYSLTPSGIAQCVELQKRELRVIRDMMAGLDAADFAAAAAALKAMNARLDEQMRDPV